MRIGSVMIDFNLFGIDGKFYSLRDFIGFPVLILIVSCNHCPYVKAYEDRMIELQDKYLHRGVRLVAINPNNENTHPEDSFANMVRRAKEKNFNFPYLRDTRQMLVKALNARFTPEVYLFDSARKLRYYGAIDDNWNNPQKTKRHYLKDAIEAVLAEKLVVQEKTTAVGCTIKWL